MSSHAERQKYTYEKNILTIFLRLNPIVPLASMIEETSRAIDFRFNTKTGILGIELTRCAGKSGTKKAAKERLLNSIISNAQKMYQEHSSLNFLASVHLWHTEDINKNKAERLTKEIVRLLLANVKRIKKIKPCKSRTFLLYLDRNREGRVYVYNTGWEQPTHWKRINPIWMNQHPYKLLQKVIIKKQDKLKHYKKYADQVYLLVSANKMLSSENVFFDEKLTQQFFYSKFDRVFFLDITGKRVFHLHTVPFKYQSNIWKELKKEQRMLKQLNILERL